MFRIFWQDWIGEIGKNDYQNAKIIKKLNSKRWNLWRILDFKCLYFFEKFSIIFQNSLIKSLIYKIKKHLKFFRIFWQVQVDKIEKKMLKIIKKTYSKPQNFEIENISHINMFFKRTFRIFQKSLVKSLILPIKHHKKFHIFWPSFDRWNRK